MSAAATSSSESKASSTAPKVFAPSRFVVDSNNGNKKYRLCAAAAVLNSHGHLLVGERTSIANAWQAPQGGVDAAWEENQFQDETVVQAASRELYEEMGLVVGQHVLLAEDNDDNSCMDNGIRYETAGTQNWLTKAGFAGQELHWVVFRCIDGRGDADASLMCDLTGQNGEAPEFRQVAWRSIEDVLTDMWLAKRDPYEALQSVLKSRYDTQWQKHCHQTVQNFAGTWSRNADLSHNLQAALMARGLTPEQAMQSAKAPYKQTWACNDDNSIDFPEWTVTTYADDGVTPRRTLLYPIGKWEESYKGGSTLFGESSGSEPATLKRRTFYAPQPLGEDKKYTVAHVTVSQTPKGDTEESRRYRDGEHFILQRIFWAKGSADNEKGVISLEVFVRDE